MVRKSTSRVFEGNIQSEIKLEMLPADVLVKILGKFQFKVARFLFSKRFEAEEHESHNKFHDAQYSDTKPVFTLGFGFKISGHASKTCSTFLFRPIRSCVTGKTNLASGKTLVPDSSQICKNTLLKRSLNLWSVLAT